MDAEKISEQKRCFIDQLFDEIPTMAMPKPHEKMLFEKMNIFHANCDYRKNAYANWVYQGASLGNDELFVMAKEYMECAYKLCLIGIFDVKTKTADRIILPILFLYVHLTELYLKAIRSNLTIVLGKTNANTSDKGHDLYKILNDIIEQIKQFDQKCQYKEVVDGLEGFQKLLKEINGDLGSEEKEALSIKLRYPFDRSNKQHNFTKPNYSQNSIIVDMERLKCLIELTNSVLYNLYYQINN